MGRSTAVLRALAPTAATVVAMASFQVGAAAAKGLFPELGAVGAASQRLFLGAILLLALTRPWRGWPSRAPAGPLLALGVSMAAVVALFYLAVERLPLGVAIALQFLGPLAIAVFASRKPRDLLWAALAGTGVWMLVGGDFGARRLDLTGVAFALGAAAGWAAYILAGRRATHAFGGATAALSVTLAAVLAAPAGLLAAGAAMFAPALLPLGLLVAFLATVVPFTLELYALRRLPARTFAVMMSLEPAFGVLSGLLILGEALRPEQVVGVGLVMAAASGAAWSQGAAPAAPTAVD